MKPVAVTSELRVGSRFVSVICCTPEMLSVSDEPATIRSLPYFRGDILCVDTDNKYGKSYECLGDRAIVLDGEEPRRHNYNRLFEYSDDNVKTLKGMSVAAYLEMIGVSAVVGMSVLAREETGDCYDEFS